MIERDRELLAGLARVNRHLGEVVVELMSGHDGGELPADSARELGKYLAEFGADLLARAAERDGNPITRVIIDTQPT
jgi:hypothetical protein